MLGAEFDVKNENDGFILPSTDQSATGFVIVWGIISWYKWKIIYTNNIM